MDENKHSGHCTNADISGNSDVHAGDVVKNANILSENQSRFLFIITYFKLFQILVKEFWPRLYAILCLNPKIKMFLLTQMLLEVQHLFWHQFLVTALAKQHLKMMGRSTKVVYWKLKIFLIFKGCTQLLEDSIAAVMPSPKHSISNQFRSRDTSCSGTSSSNARIQHNKFQIPCTF